MIRFLLLALILLVAAPLFAQNPAARAARCPECFPGGPVFTPYPTQVRMPSQAYFPPVFGGGWGVGRGGGVLAGVAAVATGAGIAVAVDEIQQRRAEAAEARRDRRDRTTRQVRNCRVYESKDQGAPMLMVCEDRDGNKITFEKE